MRICTNRKSAEKHYSGIETFNPGTGCIRIFKISIKVYGC